jgi:AbrB family looped-hinge helix DNA binding protein
MERIVEIGKVSARGQIAIPVDVRNKLDLKDGEKVLFILEGDTLIIRKVSAHNNIWEEITEPLKNLSKNLDSKKILVILKKNKTEINKYGAKMHQSLI